MDVQMQHSLEIDQKEIYLKAIFSFYVFFFKAFILRRTSLHTNEMGMLVCFRQRMMFGPDI